MGVLTLAAFRLACGLWMAAAEPDVDDAAPPPPAPSATEKPHDTTVLVIPLTARAGLAPDEVAVLSDYLASQAHRIPGFRVLSMVDVETMMGVEGRKQLLGCDQSSCLAEIGGAMNAEELLVGEVGKLGERELVLTVRRLGTQRSAVISSESERIAGGGRDAALDGISRVLHRMFPTYQPPPPRVRPLSRSVVVGLITGVGAALQYAAFASMFTSALFWPCPILALGMLGISGVACCSAPIYISAAQAWLMDLVGRRQAGFRHAAWVGLALLVVDGVLTLAASGVLALAGYVVGYIGPSPVTGRSTAADFAWRLIFPVVAKTNNTLSADMALLGAFMGLWAGLIGLVTIVPFAQAMTLFFLSRERSPDVEAQRPTLYAVYEKVPGFLSWIPCRVLGGTPRDEKPPVAESPPASPPERAQPNQ